MKNKLKFQILTLLTGILLTIPLFYSIIQISLNLKEGFTQELRYWLFISITFFIVNSIFFLISNKINNRFKPSRYYLRRYKKKTMAYLCLTFIIGGAIIIVAIVIIWLLVMPFDEAKLYIGFKSTLGIILSITVLISAILLSIGFILLLKGALEFEDIKQNKIGK